MMPSAPDMPQGMGLPAAGWEQGRDACAEEDSPSQPPNTVTGQEELSVTSAPDGYVLTCFLSAPPLVYSLQAVFTNCGTKGRQNSNLVSGSVCARG